MMVFSLSAQIVEKTFFFDKPNFEEYQGYEQISFGKCVQGAEEGSPVMPWHSVSLLLPQNTEAQDIEFEIGNLISELEVQEMDILRQSSLPHIDKILSLVEENVFTPAISSLAQSVLEEEGLVEESYCLLGLDINEMGNYTLLEYRTKNLEPTDKYIAMSVTLALERCGVIQKEERRSLYEVFKTTMMTGVADYTYADWEKDVSLK